MERIDLVQILCRALKILPHNRKKLDEDTAEIEVKIKGMISYERYERTVEGHDIYVIHLTGDIYY